MLYLYFLGHNCCKTFVTKIKTKKKKMLLYCFYILTEQIKIMIIGFKPQILF